MSTSDSPAANDAHGDGMPLLPLVDAERGESNAVAPSPPSPIEPFDSAIAATAPSSRRFVVAWLVSLVATVVVCAAITRSPSPLVFNIASPQQLPITERDRLFLQPNTALWPNLCDAADPDSGRNHTAAYRYQLAAAMIIRNEAAWIYECLEYHIEMGVQHFFM